MNLAAIFSKLYKPILFFLNGVWDLFLKTDAWWVSKSDITKTNLRWMLFTSLLFTVGVFREIKTTNDNIINYNRNFANTLILQKKVDLLEQKYLSKLENDIKELKEIKQVAKENEKELKEITDEK